MKRKLEVNPITFPKKGIKNTLNYYLSLFTYSHIKKKDFNPALNSLTDSASTTYCDRLFHSFTVRIKNEYL